MKLCLDRGERNFRSLGNSRFLVGWRKMIKMWESKHLVTFQFKSQSYDLAGNFKLDLIFPGCSRGFPGTKGTQKFEKQQKGGQIKIVNITG
jgi:hypothetical protein